MAGHRINPSIATRSICILYIFIYYICLYYIYLFIFILYIYILSIYILFIHILNPSHWSSKPFTIDIINPRVVAVFATTATPGAGRQDGHGGEKTAIEIVDLPSGEPTFCHGKIHHFSWENPLFLWPCSIAFS